VKLPIFCGGLWDGRIARPFLLCPALEWRHRGHNGRRAIWLVARAQVPQYRNFSQEWTRRAHSGVVCRGAEDGAPEKVYVYSTFDSGKAKRIRNNGRVRVAPCDVRGKLLGEWVEARAEVVTGAEAEHGMKLLNKKYLPWKQLLDFFSFFSRNKRVVFLIRPA
jgi:PPOX class probable F420-dependent enzyme